MSSIFFFQDCLGYFRYCEFTNFIINLSISSKFPAGNFVRGHIESIDHQVEIGHLNNTESSNI